MSFPFNAQHGLIVIEAELEGPTGSIVLRLALDTGATDTLLNAAALVTAGYDLALAPSRVQVTTGSGVAYVPRLPVSRLKALGQERTGFLVLGHTLPPSAGVDGVLGLDFLRGLTLTVDFRQSDFDSGEEHFVIATGRASIAGQVPEVRERVGRVLQELSAAIGQDFWSRRLR